MYLSKSDFQLGSTCAQKLIYKKRDYETTNDSNEYMKMLAQGGYVVGHLATLFYPEGIEIIGSTAEALESTKAYLEQDKCVIFEAAILSGQKLIRIDILEKNGNQIKLIEVKSKSTEGDSIAADPDEKYIQDVAYQYMILSEAYPKFEIKSYLFVPDKQKRTTIDGLAGWFTAIPAEHQTEAECDEFPAQRRPKFRKPVIQFKFERDPNREQYIQRIKEDAILSLVDVTEKVLLLQNRIWTITSNLLSVLNNNSADGFYKIDKSCKTCEFRLSNSNQSGFHQCWGKLANPDPHIFDLYHGGSIGSKKSGFYLNELIDQKRTALVNIDSSRLSSGVRADRQIIQLENTKNNTEWISKDFKAILSGFEFPLHFIDFETYLGAVPFHENMRPYELLAFQWSVHTIDTPGATPRHHEWIHTGNDFPNFSFAEALMKVVGTTGTPFMWATHENTVLKSILGQMEDHQYSNNQLKDWLVGITKDKDRAGRLVDMNRLTLENYFHPLMKGRTSIKSVLPAIWSSNKKLHDIPHFKNYVNYSDEGIVIDPYDTLMPGENMETGEEVVKIGTAAMRAYYRIRFDANLSDSGREELKIQLLNYCKLDTLSMVIIAHHWDLK